MLDFIRKNQLWAALDGGLLAEIPGKLTVQLKTTQDLIVYNLLKPAVGACIAEIGGGDSRILPRLSKTNQCWNIEPFGGDDNGPTEERVINGVTNVQTEVGRYDPALSSNFFDYLFSVSVVDDLREDEINNFFKDCTRILRPGGIAYHAIDMYLNDGSVGPDSGYSSIRYNHYLQAFSDPGVEPIGAVLPGPPKFTTDMASNPDFIMHGWKSISPSLDELRKRSQSVLLIMGIRKK